MRTRERDPPEVLPEEPTTHGEGVYSPPSTSGRTRVRGCTFERAACDAQWLGNVDGDRARAVQDVTPATRKFVFARDKHRCRVPGCRSARNLEVHHIVHREDGGSHEPSNLALLCVGHHDAHHNGTLIIRGTADALEVLRLDEGPVDTSHVEIPPENISEVATLQTDAVLALKTLGFTKAMPRSFRGRPILILGTLSGCPKLRISVEGLALSDLACR